MDRVQYAPPMQSARKEMGDKERLKLAAKEYALGYGIFDDGLVIIPHALVTVKRFAADTTSIDFFAPSPAGVASPPIDWETNLTGPGFTLEQGMTHVAEGLGFSHITGSQFDNGAYLAAGAEGAGGTVLNVVPITQADILDKMYKTGVVNMKYVEQNIIRNQFGLHYFPAGGGTVVDAAFATTNNNAATINERSAAFVKNGIPHVDNVYRFTRKVIIEASQRITLTAKWQAAFAGLATPIKLVARMPGMLFSLN